MDYRREIDGLRAVAVLPVILFHAGFGVFSGGFVGVDVFFVISGYLITTIIISDLEQGRFSIVNFYERRARRILPTLFLVMFLCLVAGYFLLMPDEFKNFGQSLVSTSLFSNNVLLALTSGYWDLTSEFKPLLHTWSLGVEEQYYVVVPILLLFCWKFRAGVISYLHWLIFLSSLLFAIWLVNVAPDWAFYTLPTRAWEIAIGALAGLYLRSNLFAFGDAKFAKVLDSVGLMLIVFSVLKFDQTVLSPGYCLLVPTIGAVLIVVFCRPGSSAYMVLSNRVFVFIGGLSYSLYIWHQPIFAYSRAYSKGHPSLLYFLGLLPLVFLMSYLSWKFVETPFRDKSLIKRRSVFAFSIGFSVFFVASGLYLNKSYGMPLRVFDSSIRIEDMDKRIYNERAFSFKSDTFSMSPRTKILIVGNSFARDFLNITVENYDVSGVELIYRDDFDQCIVSASGGVSRTLFTQADVIVFASGSLDRDCVAENFSFAKNSNKSVYYIGTKNFGYNLNWLIRLRDEERRNRFNAIPTSILKADSEMSKAIPSGHYISLLSPTLVDGMVPVTDDLGRMLSTDRAHLTKYGAIYFGKKAVVGTSYSDFFK